MKQLGMEIPYVGSHGIANRTFHRAGGDAAEGVVFPRAPAGAGLHHQPEQKAGDDLFIERYSYNFGEPPNTFAGYAWEAIALLVDAIGRREHRSRCHPNGSERDTGLRWSRRSLQLLGHQPYGLTAEDISSSRSRRHLGAGRIDREQTRA